MEKSDKLIIALVGRNTEAFERLFTKLASAIEQAISYLASEEISTATQENINDVVGITKEFIAAKLQKPSLENQKLLAEIVESYANAEEKRISSERIRAETKAIELDNAIKQLRYALEAIQLIKEVRTVLVDGQQFVIDLTKDRESRP